MNGVRIEPGEIEAALVAHADVTQALVTAVAPDGAAGGKRLVAYLTTRTQLTADALRAHLRDRLPDSHLPAHFRFLDAFPLTRGGKVDRAALPAPETPEADSAAFVAPRDAAERLVAGVWADLLKRERVSALDDFFALGGSSLQLPHLLRFFPRAHACPAHPPAGRCEPLCRRGYGGTVSDTPASGGGHSGTPLAKKLGVRPGQGHRLRLLHAEPGWVVPGLPGDIDLAPGGPRGADITVAFYRSYADLAAEGETLVRDLADHAMVWIAWPRKAAGHVSDLTENGLRDLFLPLGLVDVKVAALGEDWSGLKFVRRRENRRKGDAK
ncbi:AMP-binding enzyme [Streptomyces griseoruber]|uniref:AMP-binding enzyme n=1 Tax=Streptomyces griseoruber TaxID=1943 RepID=UPI00379464B5